MRNLCLKLKATSFPLADANGNCVSFIDEAGNVQAHYEYDAFGGTISQSGAMADDFRVRFSSKYLDDETGLYCYGYRYYPAFLGRWVNRDPINEFGGPKDFRDDFDLPPEIYVDSSVRQALERWVELEYVFCDNVPVHKYDYLGLDADCVCPAGSKKGKKQNPDNFKKTDNICTRAPKAPNPSGYASFLPACLAHDTCYASCFKTKLECDKSFIKDLAKACSGVSDPKQKKSCVFWAALYASGPIVCGDSIFAGSQTWTKLQNDACMECCCD